ncbi:Bacterial transcriptional regulator [Sphingomonas sp. HMP9]|uniref:IclR family transcriptional regulator n=1 Tax=Sphingomonas sp. HMP9 TaxID=1517554 RepID=UPI0015969115|nr:IclR family transcriptional regulator [Sphingomonas sp. HMP9]BCA61016.1 Bacterial transcriptional regulator [Sphingomonas sp. HMP9]
MPPISQPPKPDTKDAGPRVYSAPALEKAIDIVELLAREPSGLTVTDIANRLSRSISELFRVIVVLDRRGWLHKDPASDRYRVTYKLLETAHRATPAQELTHVAAPLMHALSAAAMQSCHLVVVSGTRGLIVLRQESPGPTGFAVRLGTSIALATNCSGHVLLAFMREDTRTTILDETMDDATDETRRDLDAHLAAIRERGHEWSQSNRMAGVSDMSCPIFGYDGRVVAALTIPFLEVIDETPHIAAGEALVVLKRTAMQISQALGWYEPSDAAWVPRPVV